MRRSVVIWALAGLGGLAGAFVFSLWTPGSDPANALCFSRRVLDVPCPGCGLTRAFAHLAKGEWREALVLHPLAPVVAAELGLAWGAWGLALAGRRPRRLRFEHLALANAAALAALWLGRAATGTLPW